MEILHSLYYVRPWTDHYCQKQEHKLKVHFVILSFLLSSRWNHSENTEGRESDVSENMTLFPPLNLPSTESESEQWHGTNYSDSQHDKRLN